MHILAFTVPRAQTAADPRGNGNSRAGVGRAEPLLTAALCPGARPLGVDPAEQMVEVARKRVPAATIAIAVAEALPVPDASVGMVFSCVSFVKRCAC